MKRYLVVGDYNRKDFIAPFQHLPTSVKLYFIEHPDKSFVKNTVILPENSKIVFWKDYSDAFELINKLGVEKIFFFFIEAYNHAALRMAAAELRVETVHVEHGLRFNMPVPHLAVSVKKTIIDNNILLLKERIKNFSFFLFTLLKVRGAKRYDLTKFLWYRRKGISNIYHPEIRRVITPDSFISFAPEIFKYHINKLDWVGEHVIYTGIPQFDDLVTLQTEIVKGENIIFIDQPLVEKGIMGWTEDHRKKLLDEMISICKRQNRKFLIKIHPISDQNYWENFTKANSEIVRILDDAEFKHAIERNFIIIGFCSTLHLPLASLAHTVLFCLEMHPIDLDIQPSSILTEAGVACAIPAFSDIEFYISRAKKELENQKPYKAEFSVRYLYKVDGKSTERFIDAVLA